MGDRATDTRDDQLLTVADIVSYIGSQIGYRIRRSDYEAFLRRRSLLGAIT